MLKLLSLLLFLLSGCREDKKPDSTPSISSKQELAEKADIYKKLLSNENMLDPENKFIFSEGCDSLLFSGLLSAAAPDLNINIPAAYDENTDSWMRNPDAHCSPEQGTSRSTISRDMLLGLMYYLYYNKDLPRAIKLMDSLKANGYVLKGKGTGGELLVNPNLLNTLACVIIKLGGPVYPVERALPVYFSLGPVGYERHLTVWHILLRAETIGGVSDNGKSVLEQYVKEEPKNPLFQAAYHRFIDGDQSEAIKLLLDKEEWPEMELPTSLNHCSPWPIERAYDPKDWGPCDENKQHPGAELILIYQLIIRT